MRRRRRGRHPGDAGAVFEDTGQGLLALTEEDAAALPDRR